MLSRMNGSKQVAIISSITLIAFLVGACGILPSEGINDAMATSAPTLTPAPPTVTQTSTLEVVYVTVTPSPPPTQAPLPIFTPDAIQLERWQEYQTELAKVLLYGYGPDASKNALCEWDILGRSGQEVYVWAFCITAGGNGIRPAVIYLETDGSIQKVTSPAINNATWDSQIKAMFPEDVREKLDRYYFNVCVYCGRPEELRLHLNYRETHPEEPPLVILSATTATPTLESTPVTVTIIPTQPFMPVVTPNAIQVAEWKEYERKLVKAILSEYDPALYDSALCEWDIVGQSNQEVYVWAICALRGGENNRQPAVIYLSGDGKIQSVKVAGYKGQFYDLELFPADVREKLKIYLFPPNSGGRPRELGQHLEYRQTHPEEPPLVVLSALSTITPMP